MPEVEGQALVGLELCYVMKENAEGGLKREEEAEEELEKKEEETEGR